MYLTSTISIAFLTFWTCSVVLTTMVLPTVGMLCLTICLRLWVSFKLDERLEGTSINKSRICASNVFFPNLMSGLSFPTNFSHDYIQCCRTWRSSQWSPGGPKNTEVQDSDAMSAHKTEGGVVYHYNALTRESTYQRPLGYKGEVVA